MFIERIKSYLEKWLEIAGLEKEYEALRDLFIKEQSLNAWPRELAAHLREHKDQSLQALADAAKRYLEAHKTSSRIRYRELTSRRNQRKPEVEEAGLRINRFVLLAGQLDSRRLNYSMAGPCGARCISSKSCGLKMWTFLR